MADGEQYEFFSPDQKHFRAPLGGCLSSAEAGSSGAQLRVLLEWCHLHKQRLLQGFNEQHRCPESREVRAVVSSLSPQPWQTRIIILQVEDLKVEVAFEIKGG